MKYVSYKLRALTSTDNVFVMILSSVQKTERLRSAIIRSRRLSVSKKVEKASKRFSISIIVTTYDIKIQKLKWKSIP